MNLEDENLEDENPEDENPEDENPEDENPEDENPEDENQLAVEERVQEAYERGRRERCPGPGHNPPPSEPRGSRPNPYYALRAQTMSRR